MHVPPSGTETTGSGGGRPVVRTAAIAAVVVLVAVAAVFLLVGRDAHDDDGDSPAQAAPATGEAGDGQPGAASPEAAVEGFLTAEGAGDYESSYAFLSDGDREEFISPAAWVSAHADVLAPVLGHEPFERVDSGRGSAEVTGLVEFEAGLDPVSGLAPGRARVTWVVEEGRRGWGVGLADSRIAPIYPDEVAARTAAVTWVGQAQQCDPPPPPVPLLGVPSLADRLCGAAGDVVAGEPAPLGLAVGGAVDATYGPESMGWARAVALRTPLPMTLVLAPIGDEWVVIGLFAEP